MEIIKKISCLFIIAALAISMVGCGDTKTTDRIEKSGKLIVGTSADYAPYEYHTLAKGKDKIVGIDISIVEEIAKDLGVKLEIVDMGYNELLSALDSGKVDIVVGLNQDTERKKSVDFSKIYYKPKQGILVRTADRDKIKSIADLSGKKVGAQSGTVQQKIAKMQIKDAKLITLGRIEGLVGELKDKKIDALIVELPVANNYTKIYNELTLSGITVEEYTEGSAVAVKKNNSDLVGLINKSLDRLTSEGSIEKFVQEANDKNVTK